MRLFIDTDTNSFISDPGFKAPVSDVSFKRGDASQVQLSFVSENTSLSATNDKLIILGIKESEKYDGEFLVSTNEYTTSGKKYILNPSFNTVELNDLLNSGDADDSNDVGSVDTMLEISWSEDEGETWYSSNTITATIDNDVIKGNEGTPLENPSPLDWLEEQLEASTKFAKLTAINSFTTSQIINGSLSASELTLLGGQDSGAIMSFVRGDGVNSLGFLEDSQTLNGNNVYAFGFQSSLNNTGNSVNALGNDSAYGNTGNDVNALGNDSAYQNIGSDINALGISSAFGNTGSYVNALGAGSAYQNSGTDVNALGFNSGNFNSGNSVNALGNASADGNQGSDVNALGNSSALGNTGNYVNALGSGSSQYNTGNHNQFLGSFTTTSPQSLSGCIVLGSYAMAVSSNQLALGSTDVPLLTSNSGTSIGKYLVIQLNGTTLKIPLYS